jgi:hypothetical protein
MRAALVAASKPHDLKVMLQQKGLVGPARLQQPAPA